jgi:hypothetical protein
MTCVTSRKGVYGAVANAIHWGAPAQGSIHDAAQFTRICDAQVSVDPSS